MKGIIVKGVGGRYVVNSNGMLYFCTAKGLFRKKNLIPTVGDRVEIEPSFETDQLKANIISIFPRESLLVRPPVANATKMVLVVGAANPDPNLRQLDKMIINSERQGLKVVICINKSDLSFEMSEKIFSMYRKIGYPVYCTDAMSGVGVFSLRSEIRGEITAFSGPSGVGKSTLINYISGREVAQTGEISAKNQRGKHTTRHVELIEVEKDTWLFDTPGFTSLETFDIASAELGRYFLEFRQTEMCKFNNCQHLNEPNCTVLKGLQEGKIFKERYDSYLSIYQEIKSKEKY